MESRTNKVRELQRDGTWLVLDEESAEHLVEVLMASGRLWDFDIADIPADELREKVQHVQASQRLRYAEFSETREARTW